MLAARARANLEAAAECRAAGGEAVAVVADVTDPASLDVLLQTAGERFGRVDTAVSAAAVVAYRRFDELPAELFDQVRTTNLIGTATVAGSALRAFRAAGGGQLVLVGWLCPWRRPGRGRVRRAGRPARVTYR